MKKFYSFLFLITLLCLNFQSKANEIIVKGYVRFANGTPAAGVAVKIFVEAPCVVEHSVVTNNDGFYTDKVSCPVTIKKVRISIICQGQTIVQLKEVSATNVVEANFTMCTAAVACVAKFNFAPATPSAAQKFPIKFSSSGAETIAGDKIVERKWTFGDGETNSTSVDPVHNYLKPGVYNVCLTIKTAKGCISTKCQNVEIKAFCKSSFNFEPTLSGIRFNSSTSVGATNDPVKGRTWNFGDGSPVLQGNIDPLHVFPRAGTYTVCLTIWTNSGCESKECKQVVVPALTAAACVSRFSFEKIAPKNFRFNSSLSVTASGDYIVERQWEFGDGTAVIKNNEVSTLHEFSKPGMYEVCLKIKTAKGCESSFCLPVKVEEKLNNTEEPLIKIITLYPAPFKNELKAVIFSRNPNVMATISIIDVYGQIKLTKQVLLVQGNNPFELATSFLLPGPYFFRITTSYGTQTKPVYKL